jgi:hypothetical protein
MLVDQEWIYGRVHMDTLLAVSISLSSKRLLTEID